MDGKLPDKSAPERMVWAFESAELILYGAVGVLLVVIAVLALAAEVDSIRQYLTGNPVMGLSSLIAAIIALELLMTVVGYMKTRSISLGLLLGAALTAMVREIIIFAYQPTNSQYFVLILLATALLVAAVYFVGDKTIHT